MWARFGFHPQNSQGFEQTNAQHQEWTLMDIIDFGDKDVPVSVHRL